MKIMKNIALGVVVFALFACDHPFKAGLGPVEDVRPPTVTLVSPGAGDYIYGLTVFSGDAEDDYRLVSVEIMVVNYPEKTDIAFCQNYVPVNLEINVNKGKWDYPIDTTLFPDGDLKIRLRATDSVNKVAETDQIVFMVSNSLPAITVSMPYIARGSSDGEVGGAHLNYQTVDGDLPIGLTFQRQMNKGGNLSGTISHDEDIYLGKADAATDRYPPQVRVWKIEDNATGVASWRPGVLPPTSDVPWVDLSVENETLMGVSLGVYQFLYPVPPDVGCFYGFELRAQTKPDRARFHYPRDFYPPRDWDSPSAGDFEKENRYVLFFVRTPRELPTLDIYGLEDILGKDGWNDTEKRYNLLTVESNHPYVDKNSTGLGKVNKNGDFILRLKAYHTEGIRSAEVYWEKDGERGRFIWDLANAAPPDYPLWDNTNNVAETNPYSFWGYRDPHVAHTRNFIFTYHHGGVNRVPNGAAYHEQVRNRATIQRYIGPDNLWANGKKDGQWPTWSVAATAGMWADMENNVLPEGEYSIEVYTRSINDTAKTNPTTCVILLDRTAPEVEITTIEGVRDFTPAGTTRVNGVIRPQLRIVEVGSGIKTSGTYFSPYEQRYIVIPADDIAALTTLINSESNWWPDPSKDGLSGGIPAAIIKKDGPVMNSTFKFKTSNIYKGNNYPVLPPDSGLSLTPNSSFEEDGILPNGDYYLYVFARDNAFNVGKTSIKFAVDHLSDFPDFDFLGTGISLDVKDPNTTADSTATGFRYDSEIRNRLSPGANIRFTLRDDDSLDLGTASADSKVWITFAGSEVDATTGKITEWTPLILSQTMIKNIFVPQSEGSFGGRSAVTEREGTINQSNLLAVMTGDNANAGTVDYKDKIPNLDSYSNLPDGIYHFNMTVNDYAPAKLIIEGQHTDTPAAVAQKTVDFWIAVDTVAPDVSNVAPESGSPLNFDPDNGLSTITGIVSDQNGPITGEVKGVRKRDGTAVPFTGGITYGLPRPTDANNPGLWMENFTANITLDKNIPSETYIFTLAFTDRFGGVKTVDLRYTLDKTPPTVALLTKMKTFSRPVVSGSDADILTNGIVSFAITARDDGPVDEVRWWLLPDGEKPTGWDYLMPVAGGVQTTPLDTTNSLATNKKGGRTANSEGKPWYVSTGRIPLTGPVVAEALLDGRYNLYVAARDGAGNITSFTNIDPLQTIYVLQEQDLPWFGAANSITPDEGSGQGVIGERGAVVRGSIYEDDGFFLANGSIREGSISIWMSQSENAASIPLTNDRTDPPYGTYGYVKGTNIPANAVSRASGSNNLNLLINLREITAFNGILSADGRKHYIIEARDSYVNKFEDENGTVATSATDITEKVRRRHFSFVYDFEDPVITVTSPADGVTFGANSHLAASAPRNFVLSATIKDTYLDTLPFVPPATSGNYYISYRLNKSGDTSGDFKTLDLGVAGAGDSSSASGISISSNTTIVSERTLSFTLTEEKVNELIGYEGLDSGDYTLYLQVKDQSGKTGRAILNFHKDKDPPSFTFTNIDKRALPTIGTAPPQNWWASGTTNFAAKRAALEAMPANGKLSVIQYTAGETVTIEGTITDTLSDVDKNSFKYYFDNLGANTVPTGTPTPSVAVSITGTGKNVNWTIALTNIPDGVHSLRIEVADVGGNTLSAGTDYYGFILVTKQPTVAIDRLNGTQTTPIGGIYPVPPVLLMGDYSAARAVQSTDAVFIIGGAAASPSLADVELKISYPGQTAWRWLLSGRANPVFPTINYPANATVAYLETGTWSCTVTRADIYRATGMSATSTAVFPEGTYELSAVAVDKSGNKSEESLWSFIVDSSKPTVEFTNPGKRTANADAAEPDNRKPTYWLSNLSLRNVIMVDEPKLQASISDKNTLSAAQYQIRKFNYSGGTGTPPNGAWGDYYNGSTGATVTEAASWINITIPVTAGTDYTWELPITNLADGYYYVRVRARDSSVLYDNATANKGNWNNTGATAGDGNPGDSRYAYFFLSRDPPDISHVDEDKTSFSSRVINGNTLGFAITAKDPTWFERLDVEVKRVNASNYPTALVPPAVRLNTGSTTNSYGDVADGWTQTVNIQFPVSGANALQDGSYDIYFTVTNLAGRPSEKKRTITLDNTAPKGVVATPQTINSAWPTTGTNAVTYPPHVAGIAIGETLYGGEDQAVINGTTEDKGDNGSASNVAEIWYHLGYVGTQANNEYTNNALAFPTEATVRGNGVTGLTLIGGNDLGGTANNARFDAAARDLTTAWFKYDPKTYGSGTAQDPSWTYPRPYGVDLHGADLISWEFIVKKGIGEIASYAKPNFTLKTGSSIRYNPATGSGQWMVKKINPSLVPTTVRKNGLYSLPLWVRVADTAGNVSYFCKDIWLYPNGDYPSNTFSNPNTNLGQTNAKGGQFPIEGVASDNRSIKKVIYRVKADNVSSVSGTPTYNANWETLVPANDKIVYREGITDDLSVELGSIPDYDEKNNNPFANAPVPAGKLSKDGWYYATLESGTPAPSMPWSIIINAQNEITNLLADDASTGRWFADGGNRYTRLYIEVFAFDGLDSGANNYNKISLGGDNEYAPQPDIRVLYVTSSAPTITNLRLSNQGTFDSYTQANPGSWATAAYTAYDRAAYNLRSKRFAVRMDLYSGSTTRNIASISVRRSGGGDTSGWKEVWKTGDTLGTATQLPMTGEGAGVFLNRTNAGTAAQNITMTYSFDSLIRPADTQNGFARVQDGGWRESGGTFTVEVQIKDNDTGEAIARFDIATDNFAPIADPRDISRTPGKVAGTNAAFIGRVFDFEGRPNAASPAHRGIDRVLVWFTTNANANGTADYINLNKTATTVATTTMSARRGRTADVVGTGDTITSVTLTNSGGDPVNVTYPNPSSASSVDYLKTLSAATSGVQGSQITWQPTTDQDIAWTFLADTTKMPDGRIYLNYLVVDQAGNASYYQQTMVVMNKYPQITNVTLRTDNMGVGAVFTTHEGDVAQNEYTIPDTPFAAGYLDSGFISKNQFIAFGVDAIGGNDNLNYRVQYVKRISVPLTRANLIKMANKNYTNGGADIGNTSLYTINNKGNVDDYTWGVFGMPVTQPSAGNHFVFQAAESDVNTLQDFSGTVWGYQVVGTVAKSALNTGHSVPINVGDNPGPLNFQGTTFFNTGTGPQDANKILETNATNGATAFFLIKVWDTITNSGVEDDMLYDAVVVGMQVYLTDGTSPTARLYDLNPYTETAVVNNNLTGDDRTDTISNAADPIAIGSNILRGGLFNVKTEREVVKSGYIDPRAGTNALNPEVQDPNTSLWRATRADGFVTGDVNTGGPTQDKVSGKVILRGVAWDDQFIREIRIKIGDDPNIDDDSSKTTEIGKAILRLTDITENGNVVRREMRPVGGAQAFAYEELHWKNGHTVEWAYVWDTEKEPVNAGGVYRDNVVIRVQVIDRNGDANTGRISTQIVSSSATTRTYNQITVDIVPYVVGLERASQYSTIRSRQGWYSFFQGEAGIAVLGYNLGTTTSAPGIAYTATTTNPGTTMGNIAINNVANRFPFPLRYTFTVPTGAVSGRINVTATGGTGASGAAYNHTSAHANKSWNRENSASIAGSDLWINKPHAHIWRTTNNNEAPRTYFGATGNTSTDPTSPGLALEYASGTANPGRLHAVWTSFGSATYYYGDSGGDRQTMQAPPSGDPFGETDISMYNGTGTPNISAVYQNDGGPLIVLRTTMNSVGAADQTNRSAQISHSTDPDANRKASERWRNTRIAKAAANVGNTNDAYGLNIYNDNTTAYYAGRAYVTAYDSQGKYLWFGMRTRSGTGTDNTHVNYTRIIDGVTGTDAVDGNIPITVPTGSVAASANKGEFSAVDYDNLGPVIAYYDQQNDTVRIAFGSNINVSSNFSTRTLPGTYTGSGANTTNDYANNTRYFTSSTADYPNLVAGDVVTIDGTQRYVLWIGTTGTGNALRYRIKVSGGLANTTVWPTANNTTAYTVTVRGENTTTMDWTRRELLLNTHALYKGSGQYISLKVDKSNGIHLAFYNSIKQAVVYAYMANRNTTAATVQAYTVDNVIQGGKWTDISVDDNGTPWIVYGNTSRMGNYDGVRVAYRSNSTGGTSNTGITFTDTAGSAAGWEAVSMPASYTIKNDRLNIEAWPPTNRAGGTLGTRPTGTENAWSAAIGYASDLYRIGYFYYPAYKGY
jgi:hypothetical protein